jgi:hypothetical protein
VYKAPAKEAPAAAQAGQAQAANPNKAFKKKRRRQDPSKKVEPEGKWFDLELMTDEEMEQYEFRRKKEASGKRGDEEEGEEKEEQEGEGRAEDDEDQEENVRGLDEASRKALELVKQKEEELKERREKEERERWLNGETDSYITDGVKTYHLYEEYNQLEEMKKIYLANNQTGYDPYEGYKSLREKINHLATARQRNQKSKGAATEADTMMKVYDEINVILHVEKDMIPKEMALELYNETNPALAKDIQDLPEQKFYHPLSGRNMKQIWAFYKADPTVWTVRRLAFAFGVPKEEIAAILHQRYSDETELEKSKVSLASSLKINLFVYSIDIKQVWI